MSLRFEDEMPFFGVIYSSGRSLEILLMFGFLEVLKGRNNKKTKHKLTRWLAGHTHNEMALIINPSHAYIVNGTKP